MEMLFGGGKGEIFKESLNWLDSDHEHLQLSGALAVGNFARSGKLQCNSGLCEHCGCCYHITCEFLSMGH
ncbi:hypothetical protein DPMN_181911 [Dreissena polymorpha]|uniref:Uncharacterized protein n=1 Tax=Dreissena polymorpha TaxID=45954 RepID=A0A9D4DH34_DREPO|nr:hypothetical protein DPMN_181911 [Dreissena polymorpha]